VTNARTRVGIVEWARRASGARDAELWLADALGVRIGEVPEPAAKIALARRARVHGWHAELWKSVVPVLHDVDAGAVDFVGRADRGDAEAVRARLEDDYSAWRSETSEVAEAPILRVLDLIQRNHTL
jgi:hypothetical protein